MSTNTVKVPVSQRKTLECSSICVEQSSKPMSLCTRVAYVNESDYWTMLRDHHRDSQKPCKDSPDFDDFESGRITKNMFERKGWRRLGFCGCTCAYVPAFWTTSLTRKLHPKLKPTNGITAYLTVHCRSAARDDTAKPLASLWFTRGQENARNKETSNPV